MPVFKKISLNHEKIISSINSYPDTVLMEKKGNNYHINCNKKDVVLSIWLLADGVTTINSDVGTNKDLGLKIAEHIIENCKYSDAKIVNSSIRGLTKEDFNLILLFIKDEIKDVEIKEIPVASGIKYEVKNNTLKDTFNVTRYTNGNTHLQGKPLGVYSALYAILSEMIPDDDIIRINNDVYNLEIKKVDMYNELESLLPTAYDKLCETTKKMLMSSITLKKIGIDLDDYGCFAFGALRGLEAFIKVVINKKGYTIPPKSSLGELFYYDGSRFIVGKDFKRHVNLPNTNSVLEGCYNFYNQNRHGVFHADNMPMMSRLINKDEANKIIKTVCELIEEGTNEI